MAMALIQKTSGVITSDPTGNIGSENRRKP